MKASTVILLLWFAAIVFLVLAFRLAPAHRAGADAEQCASARAWLAWGDAQGADLGRAKIDEWCK